MKEQVIKIEFFITKFRMQYLQKQDRQNITVVQHLFPEVTQVWDKSRWGGGGSLSVKAARMTWQGGSKAWRTSTETVIALFKLTVTWAELVNAKLQI